MIDYSTSLPVIESADVLVIGGGPAGIGAAVACARLGCKTVLLERYGYLGGMATAALVGPFMTSFSRSGKVQVVRGVFDELVREMEKEGGAIHPSKVEPGTPFSGYYIADHNHVTPFEVESLKKVASEYCLGKGVLLKLHSFFTDVIISSKVDGVNPSTGKALVAVVANKSGLQGIASKLIVDCTGDADVAAKLGVPLEKGRAGDNLMQPSTMFFRIRNVNSEKLTNHVHSIYPGDKMFNEYFRDVVAQAHKRGEYSVPKGWITMFQCLKPDEWRMNTTRVLGIDGTDSDSLTKAEVEGRRQVPEVLSFLKKNVPGCENVELMDTANQIGIRETRRIRGRYILTREDLIKCRPFEDAIASYSYGLDIHNPEGEDCLSEQIEGEAYQIPYRCLLPESETQLLVAGRCISASHEALSAVRVMPCCFAMGEAAGTAAALSLKHETVPSKLDPVLLQKQLIKQGAYIGRGE